MVFLLPIFLSFRFGGPTAVPLPYPFLLVSQTGDRAESGGSTDEKPPKPPASLYSKNDAPVQLVLSIDTIGQVT